MAWRDLNRDQRLHELKRVLIRCFADAEAIVNSTKPDDLPARLGASYALVSELGAMEHAAPGIALTLAAYKACDSAQDVSAHKDEHVGGFSARAYDTAVTVPFLMDNHLPRNVETHWLSQTFSFAPEFRAGLVLKTAPRKAGPLLVETISAVEADGTAMFAEAVVIQILLEKIKIRNAGRVVLTRPKDLSIEVTIALVGRHIKQAYRRNAPRLPQLVIYAVYKCLLAHVGRYQGCQLEPLGRMKSADRKADTIGDIVVTKSGIAIEAVEIKQQPIKLVHVSEAIDKVRAVSVRRYYMLSTDGVAEADIEEIERQKLDFLKRNGCEIIINGVLESLSYYLRLLPDTNEFVFNYADLIETDEDTSYEHREAWNSECQQI